MIPEERDLVARLKDKPFTLLGINSDRDRSVLKTKLADNKINWPNLYEGQERKISRRWNVSAYPTIYILDHKGIIRSKGHMGVETIASEVEKLLKDVPTP